MSLNDSDKKVEATRIENVAVESPSVGFGAKAKRHCSRFWLPHLIVFCISFLIITFCLVYVAMPKIAQNQVNDSTLAFDSIEFLDPTPETINLTQVATLYSPSIFSPTLDAFTAEAWLVTNGTFSPTPFFNINLPKIHAKAKGDTTVSVDGQLITYTNLTDVAEYSTQVLTNEYVTTALTGETTLHLGALPSVRVKYNKTITYKGLNGLKGFNVTDARINVSAPAGTPSFRGNAFIPNPSGMTIVMGNVTLNLNTTAQGLVGNSTIENMILYPGNNSLPMTSIINQTKVIDSLDTTTGIVKLLITGSSAIYNGEHLEYYETALKSNVLELSLNISQIVADST